MAATDLIGKINAYYPKCTKAERKVADVVLSHPERVLSATITELAEMCGVGETSVFRFCRSLSLDGYQEFKVSLALSTNLMETFSGREPQGGCEAGGIEPLVKSVYQSYLAALGDALACMQIDAVTKAVDLFERASFLWLFGFGGSGITALEAQNKFLKITPNVAYHADSHTQLITASLLPASAAAVVFSNSGTTKDAITAARLAHENGASVVFITKYCQTPAARYADVVLTSGAIEGPMQGGSIAGKISQMFMVDVLFAAYYKRLGDVSLEHKRRTAAVIAEKML